VRGLLALGCAALAACSGHAYQYPAAYGLRWTGDATVAGARDGTALGGPAVRFRAGGAFADGDGARDWLVGSWGGLELSGAVLTGAGADGRAGSLLTLGLRPWLSRRQSRWFLRTEQISVLGVLIPDAGLAYGLGVGPRFQLGWQLPLGGERFQIVPGIAWISPGGDQQLLGTVAVRVPM
jgi:hypothetical protein